MFVIMKIKEIPTIKNVISNFNSVIKINVHFEILKLQLCMMSLALILPINVAAIVTHLPL